MLVVGVGGAGGNAVDNMIRGDLRGVEFCAVNTDAQALGRSLASRRLQIGPRVTRGLGAGARVAIGQVAAEESLASVKAVVAGADMVFVTAGMGGGTGTGAAPVIARAARELGILTVGVVTKPFHFEGAHRMRLAEGGIVEMQAVTDTLLVVPNQNLFGVSNAATTFIDAFRVADEVLHAGVRGVTDLMVMPGLVNLDFADVRAVMADMGQAMMGTGEAEGENRGAVAAAAAIANPLIEEGSMRGAKGVLVNVTGGSDVTLFDVDEAVGRVRDEADPQANIIFGSTFNKKLEGRIRICVVATGIAGGAGGAMPDDAALHRGMEGSGSPRIGAAFVAPALLRAEEARRRRKIFRARRGWSAAGVAILVLAGIGVTMVRGRDGVDPLASAPQDEEAQSPTPSQLLALAAVAVGGEPALPTDDASGISAEPVPTVLEEPLPLPPVDGAAGGSQAAGRIAKPAARTGYRLQIGALRSREDAWQEWQRLRRAHADLLDRLEVRTTKIELVGQGEFWRVRVGPIADKEAAETLCGALRSRNARCLLVAR